MSEFDDLVAAHHHNRPPAEFVQASGATGELAIAESPDGTLRRVVFATNRDEIRAVAQVLLCTNELDQATDLDAICRATESGAPYDLAVQSELFGPIWIEQLDQLIGSCDSHFSTAISEALDTDGVSLDGHETGLPLGDRTDPRRSFKEAELSDLLGIVAECRRWLSGGLADVTTISLEALLPPPLGTPLDVVVEHLDHLIDLFYVLEEAGRGLPFGFVEMFDDDVMADISRWQTEYGYPAWDKIHRLANSTGSHEVAGPVTTRSKLTDAFSEAHCQFGTSTIDILVLKDSADIEVEIVRRNQNTTRVRRTLIGATS